MAKAPEVREGVDWRRLLGVEVVPEVWRRIPRCEEEEGGDRGEGGEEGEEGEGVVKREWKREAWDGAAVHILFWKSWFPWKEERGRRLNKPTGTDKDSGQTKGDEREEGSGCIIRIERPNSTPAIIALAIS